MTEIKNFGFMTAEDKSKLDNLTAEGGAIKDGDGNIISETYVKKSDLQKFIADVQVDEKGVTLLNASGEPVIVLPVVAPKSN